MEDSSKPMVLIVEDDTILAKMYSEKFEMEGFEVFLARDGAEALEKITTGPIDIILLDFMLPRMGGLEVLARLKEMPNFDKIPVIALTNVAEDNEKKKAFELGVEAYMIKAMQTPDDVVKKVKEVIATKKELASKQVIS